jgi:nitrogen regulatory protein P-II 1
VALEATTMNDVSQDHPTEMLMILAIIQPFRLDAVTVALEQVNGLGAMTVSDCLGFGRGSASSDASMDFSPKVRLEIALAGATLAQVVIDTIRRVAHTGRPGDGIILVWPLSNAVHVRTAALDERALS